MEPDNSKSTPRHAEHKGGNEREAIGYFSDSELIVQKDIRRCKRRRLTSNIQDNTNGVVSVSFGMVFAIFIILLSYLVCSRMESAELRMEMEDAKEDVRLLQGEHSQTLKMLEREKYEKIQAIQEKDKILTFFEIEKKEKLEMLVTEKDEKLQLLKEERIQFTAMLETERRDKLKMERKFKEQMTLLQKNFEELLKHAKSQESNPKPNFEEWSKILFETLNLFSYSEGDTTSRPYGKTQKGKTKRRKRKRKSNRQKKQSSPYTDKRTNQKSEKETSSWWDHIDVILYVANFLK